MQKIQENPRRRRLQAANQINPLPPRQIRNISDPRSPQVLILDSHWQPHRWVPVKDAIIHEATGEVTAHIGQELFIFHGGINRITEERTIVKTATIIVVDGASKQQHRKTPALTNEVLFKRDRYVCAYCGDVHHKMTRDHVIPRSLGGKDIWTNVVTACYPCNNKKGDKTVAEFGKQLLYVPYAPCHYENMLLKGKNVLADQMDFLVAGIKNPDSRALLGNLN